MGVPIDRGLTLDFIQHISFHSDVEMGVPIDRGLTQYAIQLKTADARS